MLLELHIKNMALIEKADIEFSKGFSVLSGETGAGKSILIDSINFALGKKISKDIIREGAEYAYVELVFKIESDSLFNKIKDLDFQIDEDRILIISRKLSSTRSKFLVNDESVSVRKLEMLSSLLIDIHGQHEHQFLLSKSKHLEMLDSFMSKEDVLIKEEVKKLYFTYLELKQKIELHSDDYIREREIDILKYEIKEIENANLKENEEEKLNLAYRKLKSISKIGESLNLILENISEFDVSASISEISKISDYDKELKEIETLLYEAESMTASIYQKTNSYMEKLEYDDTKFEKIEKRLEFVNRFTSKYTSDVSKIRQILEEKKKRLFELVSYTKDKEKYQEELLKVESELNSKSISLRLKRLEVAKTFTKNIVDNLKELNFLDVSFKVHFKELESFSKDGLDEIGFLISTNKGHFEKPLKDIASGGELSRIMLSFKSMIALIDEIPCIIFDEIDTGISGHTARKVAEKIAHLSKNHQVLCITHLPQIAAMADNNYLIKKESDNTSTRTFINNIKDDDLINELARLISGSKITNAVIDTAKEMKYLANAYKNI